MGYLPAALRNYLVRLGWSHGDQEIFSTEEMIAAFDLPAIGRSAARFDFAKLENLNGHYIRHSDDQALVTSFESVLDYIPERSCAHGQAQRRHARAIAAGDAGPEGTRQDADRADRRLPLHLRRPAAEIEPKRAAMLDAGNPGADRPAALALDSVSPWTAATTEAAMRAFADTNRLKAWRGGAAAPGGADRPHHLAGDF